MVLGMISGRGSMRMIAVMGVYEVLFLPYWSNLQRWLYRLSWNYWRSWHHDWLGDFLLLDLFVIQLGPC